MSPVRDGLAMVLALAMPVLGQAQGLTIDHKQVGCIVAGKYPRLDFRLRGQPGEHVMFTFRLKR
jgi:hypothetical protein